MFKLYNFAKSKCNCILQDNKQTGIETIVNEKTCM